MSRIFATPSVLRHWVSSNNIKNMRKIKFQNGEYYHIFNKGVAGQNIFKEEKDFAKFIYKINDHNNVLSMDVRKANAEQKDQRHLVSLDTGCPDEDSRDTQCLRTLGVGKPSDIECLVEFICYSLIPNHYHFILRQLADQGISKFMHKLEMGYAKYFNRKYGRLGALFQGKFQAVHIKTNEYVLYLSGYANGNIEIHKIAKAEEWNWSSYKDYLGLRNGTLCNKEIILSQFKNVEDYKKYVEMVIENSSRRKDEIKKCLLED